MRLRSKKTIVSCVETPTSNRQRSNKEASRRTHPPGNENPLLLSEDENTIENDSHHLDEEIPMMRRRLLPRGRARKRAIAVEDRDTDLGYTTPIRSILRQKHILSEIDTVTPRNTTARNIYSPIVRFFTPSKENVETPDSGNSVLMSPEQGFFAFGSIDLLAGDEDDEVLPFNPFTFIKNIPQQSEHSLPQLKDIPPKTRSTPEATLVVDLEETLMFSSLSVIEEAEYTFYTSFQDHQYKVYMILRPHVREFLQSMAKIYELFVYTCAKKEYAKKILNILDPQRKLFRHCLYQEDCSCVLGHYVKDLNVLGRDLAKTVVLDNSPHTYPYHLMNTIPIKSWSGESDDGELQKLIPSMEKLSAADDFREVLKKRKDHFHRLLSED
ncbi:CTD small phosphatase-like protein 2 [Xyrichtys novacula]|uniref:CTD small phosphatase-like protein 2 n=1 Tax=Xyrichtys novacula TaxID=13765 RepID=A0AAV1FIE1_XYRNO|nr:CTD small phosphatase-like protein 2 [Xyrichtys novacula]